MWKACNANVHLQYRFLPTSPDFNSHLWRFNETSDRRRSAWLALESNISRASLVAWSTDVESRRPAVHTWWRMCGWAVQVGPSRLKVEPAAFALTPFLLKQSWFPLRANSTRGGCQQPRMSSSPPHKNRKHFRKNPVSYLRLNPSYLAGFTRCKENHRCLWLLTCLIWL